MANGTIDTPPKSEMCDRVRDIDWVNRTEHSFPEGFV